MSLTNSMVAHRWAQRDHSAHCGSGHSANGNFSFNGDRLISYRTPIAMFHDTASGVIALVTSRSYSMTTSSKHMPEVRRSLSHDVPAFYVPDVDPLTSADHAENMAYFRSQYDAAAKRAARTRDHPQYAFRDMLEFYDTSVAYAVAFDLPSVYYSVSLDMAEILEKRRIAADKRETPSYLAKQAKDVAAREALRLRKEELATATDFERINAWRNGENLGYAFRGLTGVALRIKGNKLETSQGATVPLADAIKVFRFAKAVRTSGLSWVAGPGARLGVGDFKVDYINADGGFRAGCHVIGWPEIERVAKLAGVFDN